MAVLDSGIGGLPYLQWLKDHLPQERLVYIADAAHFPYGERQAEDVRRVVVSVAQSLIERDNPKLLLVACNTASVLALEELRASLPIPVVGVVPAVKTAAQLGTGTVGVLATPRTVENGYWEQLVQEYAPERTVRGYAAPDLVRLVEEGSPPQERKKLLERWAQRLVDDRVDVLVLGCTHYLHLSSELAQILGSGVHIVDSRDGVGRRVQQVLSEKGGLAAQRDGDDEFWFTVTPEWSQPRLSEAEVRYREWARRFGLQLGGAWSVEP